MRSTFCTGAFGPTSAVLLAAVALPAQALTAQAHPVFVDGQAQVVAAFADSTAWIQEDLWVETEFDSDGDGRLDRVHVDVTRPGPTATEGLKVPIVYASSPYFNGTGTTAPEFFWDVNQELDGLPNPRGEMPTITPRINRPIMSTSEINRWVPRGFAVVHSASPGTGLSQGCPTVGGINESLAPKAVIDWLNGRARGFSAPIGGEPVVATWSTGKVGMTGTSYNGTLPVAAATTGVEGLEAIIPIAPNTSYYHYYRSNGLVRNPGGYPGEDVDVLFDFIHSGDLEKRPYCIATVREGEMAAKDRVTGDYNEFWAGRDYLNAMDGFHAALLMSHGFNDWNVMPEHSWRIAEAAKAKGLPVQIYYHQDGHGGGPPLEMQNRWFTRYLYDVQNGVEGDPKAWIVREGDPRDEPTPYDDYPNPAARMVSFRPGSGGSGIGSLGQAAGSGIESLVDDARVSGTELGGAAASGNRLLYATPTLSRDAHISGVPRVRIRVAADAPAANLSVWLVELPAEGEVGEPTIITRGWADPRNRNSLTDQAPLVPGEFVDLEFALQPDDQIVLAGKRIGLMIFSSDQEFTLHPEAGTVLSVDLAGTELMLPVVGGRPIAQD